MACPGGDRNSARHVDRKGYLATSKATTAVPVVASAAGWAMLSARHSGWAGMRLAYAIVGGGRYAAAAGMGNPRSPLYCEDARVVTMVWCCGVVSSTLWRGRVEGGLYGSGDGARRVVALAGSR